MIEIIENIIILICGLSVALFIDKLFWKRLILQNKDLFFDLYKDRILEAFKNDKRTNN